MALLRDEFRKLRGIRYFTVLLILLFGANLYICYRGVAVDFRPEMRGYHKTVEAFTDLYREDPAAYAETRAAMEAAIESYKRTEDEKAAADPNYSRNYRGSHCFSEEVDDELLLYNLDSRLEKFGMFDTQVEQILAQTEKSMRNMKRYEGLTMNDYRYAEQAYAHQTYAALLEETSPEFVYIRGWDRLFSFHYSDVLLMAVLLLLASLLFLPEKQTGMLPILRCSKNGGGQTAAAKLGVMSVLSVGITLLFTFGVMAVYQLSCGFSDWSVPVQSIGDLRMFPRSYSIREYFVLFLGTKLLGALAFSAIATFLSVVFYHPLLSYSSGALLAGISFWMYNLPLSTATYLPQQLNLFSIMAVKPLSTQLRVVNFFGRPVQSLTFAVFETLLLFLLFSLFTVLLHCHGSGALRFAGFERALGRLAGKGKRTAATVLKTLKHRRQPVFRKADGGASKAGSRRRYVHSIFGWELRKVFFGEPLLLLIALLMIAAQVWMGVNLKGDYRQDSSYRIYKQLYLPEIEGPLTEETSLYLDTEYKTQKSYSMSFDAVLDAYGKGEISDEEYLEYQAARDRSQYLLPVVQELLARRDDFHARLETEEGSNPGHFIDYEGYEALMTSGFSIPLFAALLFVCAASFAKEYGGKSKNEHFAVILRSTYRGRRDTFRKKCLSCCLVGLLFGVIFYGTELGFYLSTYDFPSAALGAPLFSLKAFGCYQGGMSVLSGLLLVYAMKFITLILTALLLCAVSALCKNLLQGLTVSLLGTMLPSLLVYLGLQSAGISPTPNGWRRVPCFTFPPKSICSAATSVCIFFIPLF